MPLYKWAEKALLFYIVWLTYTNNCARGYSFRGIKKSDKTYSGIDFLVTSNPTTNEILIIIVNKEF